MKRQNSKKLGPGNSSSLSFELCISYSKRSIITQNQIFEALFLVKITSSLGRKNVAKSGLYFSIYPSSPSLLLARFTSPSTAV
ncbi:hypothetical protein F383_38091 [Gossypium arboreum]|uniref:Uncharacterized protein n=1 Tax=Gossypium arboreum TaxID=29729 RepID=A0A0B0MDK0_GOSAR|nr:hypothetical protein F383_38091 [Gossypium arboreum]